VNAHDMLNLLLVESRDRCAQSSVECDGLVNCWLKVAGPSAGLECKILGDTGTMCRQCKEAVRSISQLLFVHTCNFMEQLMSWGQSVRPLRLTEP